MARRSRRDYNGDPLAVFLANREEYKGMGRGALFGYDSAMYNRLRLAGRLEEAIPGADPLRVELGRRVGNGEDIIPDEEMGKIAEYYETAGGKALNAARYFKRSVNSVIKIWRVRGLKIRRRGR